jgi:hypothetical protein
VCVCVCVCVVETKTEECKPSVNVVGDTVKHIPIGPSHTASLTHITGGWRLPVPGLSL